MSLNSNICKLRSMDLGECVSVGRWVGDCGWVGVVVGGRVCGWGSEMFVLPSHTHTLIEFKCLIKPWCRYVPTYFVSIARYEIFLNNNYIPLSGQIKWAPKCVNSKFGAHLRTDTLRNKSIHVLCIMIAKPYWIFKLLIFN